MGIERRETHDKKRQDEKDEDESPECVNNTHGQRDGQGACEKMKKAIFLHFVPGWSSQALSMDPTIVISSLRISLPFLRRPHLPDFQLGSKRILANSYLHEVLTVITILCSLPIITKKN